MHKGVPGPHLAADSGRWVKPQAGRGLGQEEEADSRGLLREGVCSGSRTVWIFQTEVREDKGHRWGVYRMAKAGDSANQLLNYVSLESLRVTLGGKVLRMGEMSGHEPYLNQVS